MPNVTDELAEALKGLYGIIAVKPSLVAKWPVCAEKARAALARYDQEQAAATDADWLEDNYTGIYVEWLEAQRPTFHIWLQEKWPEAWQEYVREKQ